MKEGERVWRPPPYGDISMLINQRVGFLNLIFRVCTAVVIFLSDALKYSSRNWLGYGTWTTLSVGFLHQVPSC